MTKTKTGQSEEDVPPTARATLARILELLSVAVHDVTADDRLANNRSPAERAALAVNFLEHEIGPLFATYVALTKRRGAPHPCPLCIDGEAFLDRYAVSDPDSNFVLYSCGHVVSIRGRHRPVDMHVVMPLNSGRSHGGLTGLPPIRPGETAEITARPLAHAMRPERLVIVDAAADWNVLDIRIGTNSQFPTGQIPGYMFAEHAPDPMLEFDVVRISTVFRITVQYVGRNSEGAEFRASVIGVGVADTYTHDELERIGAFPTPVLGHIDPHALVEAQTRAAARARDPLSLEERHMQSWQDVVAGSWQDVVAGRPSRSAERATEINRHRHGVCSAAMGTICECPEPVAPNPHECRTCYARPAPDGSREHGRGCYEVSADGGGTDYIGEDHDATEAT